MPCVTPARPCSSQTARQQELAVPAHRAVPAHGRFDDGDVLLHGSAAHADACDHPVLARERHPAADRGVSAARDGEERIELRARLDEGHEVGGAHADESGGV